MLAKSFLLSLIAAGSVMGHIAGGSMEKRAAVAKVYSTCKKSKDIALTFDDGPFQYQSKIIRLFNEANAKATFFVNGNNWACIYNSKAVSSLKLAYKSGHQIASHGWSHANSSEATSSQMKKQLSLIDTALQNIIGVQPAMFRPPYGEYTQATLKVLKQMNTSAILWDWDAQDAVGLPYKKTIANFKERAKAFPEPGLLLAHETEKHTANDVVAEAISVLQKAGYRLVTVAECLGASPYKSVGKASSRDSTWTCEGTPAPGKFN